MYQYRFWQRSDIPWLEQAAAAGAWELLDEEERRGMHPAALAARTQMQVRQALSTPGTAVLVATMGPSPVGYAVAAVAPDSTTEEPTGLLVDLWVHPAHRRRGVATALQNAVEQMAAQTGTRRMKLWTRWRNQPVVEMAQKRGYRPLGLIGLKEI